MLMLRLKEVREKRGLSMRGLSKISGVSVAVISNAESGITNLSLCSYCKICRSLGIKIDNELLDTSKCIYIEEM